MSKLKVYLAAPYKDRKALWPIRSYINEMPNNYEVIASWLDEPDGLTYENVSDEWLTIQAQVDLEEVRNTNVLMVFPGNGAGHHTEFGAALALNRANLVVIGKRNNIFHHLPFVQHYHTFEDWVKSHENDTDSGSSIPKAPA